ncbi:MAG: hypothetical protein F2839_06585 [Actinobacteria bacterium]|uniref:Unannotated protein n=1 Tax=freshwater metagenome TaxID=449393 RepID=A0A6J5ZNM4_9ZZZZ|nr:hypothetical protein [Actinomycetota bacterium]
MAICECGAQLLTTSLTCPKCGRKFTLDQGQAGNFEAASRVDWDSEFEKLTSGKLQQARVEVGPYKLSWLDRFKRKFKRGSHN